MILVAGLSPAWQQVLTFDRMEPGEVNRARSSRWYASGKPINVAATLAGRNCDHRVIVPLGGATGQQLEADAIARGMTLEAIATELPTRVCTSLVEPSGKVTELVAESPSLTENELANFLSKYSDWVKRASMVVLIGSLPARTPTNFYAMLLSQTACPAIIDARGPELLACLEHLPAVVKPNRRELETTFGRALRTDAELLDAGRELIARGAHAVVITDGPRVVHAIDANVHWIVKPPSVQVVNPIGSGDCLTATLAWALDAKKSLRESLELAVAAASKHAATPLVIP